MRVAEFIFEGDKGIKGYKQTDSFVDSLIDIIDKYPQAESEIEDTLKEFIKVKSKNAQQPFKSPKKDKGHKRQDLKPWKHAHILNASKLASGSPPLVLYYRIKNGILYMDLLVLHTSGRASDDAALANKMSRGAASDTSAVQKIDDKNKKKPQKADHEQDQWYLDQKKFREEGWPNDNF